MNSQQHFRYYTCPTHIWSKYTPHFSRKCLLKYRLWNAPWGPLGAHEATGGPEAPGATEAAGSTLRGNWGPLRPQGALSSWGPLRAQVNSEAIWWWRGGLNKNLRPLLYTNSISNSIGKWSRIFVSVTLNDEYNSEWWWLMMKGGSNQKSATTFIY